MAILPKFTSLFIFIRKIPMKNDNNGKRRRLIWNPKHTQMTLKPFGRICFFNWFESGEVWNTMFPLHLMLNLQKRTPYVLRCQAWCGETLLFRVWATCTNYGKHGSALYQKILKENVLSSVCKLKLEFKKVDSFAIWDGGTLQSSANSHLSLFCHPKSAPSILSQIRLGG